MLNSVFDDITEAFQAGEKITFIGFGTFKIVERKARKGFNSMNKQTIDIN